jgi:hypothetical protein
MGDDNELSMSRMVCIAPATSARLFKREANERGNDDRRNPPSFMFNGIPGRSGKMAFDQSPRAGALAGNRRKAHAIDVSGADEHARRVLLIYLGRLYTASGQLSNPLD